MEEVEQGDFQSIKGDPLKKVYVQNPKQVGGYNGIRDEFSETWESDIYFRTRYWLDELGPEDASDTQRILSFDIETDHSLDAANAPEKITAITAHDNFKDKYITFLLEPEGKSVDNFKNDDWSLYTFPNDEEREMLLKFIEFIQATDPDVVTAWNLDTYDGPYLLNRMRQLRIDYSVISPIDEVKMAQDYSEIRTVRGRQFIDMIPAFQKIYFDELESYKLNDVGANLLDLEKVKFETSLSQLWRDDPEKFIEYNKRDVEIMVQLDEKFRIWDLFRIMQSIIGINFQDILHNSRLTQAYFMRKADFKMPRAVYKEKDGPDFQGATVLEETPGVSENVAVLDLASQYPSSIISYNMSPEKKVESPEATDKPTVTVGSDVTFEYDELGFVPEILIELIKERGKYKKKRDSHDPDSQEHYQFDLIQYALKVIANSVYGVLGHKGFMLYDRDIARSTTYVGRETVAWTKKKAEELGYPVAYGDTDSIMMSMGEDIDKETALDKALKLAEYINESYDEYAKKNGVDLRKLGLDRMHMFEIEAEKLYQRFFQQKAQKKYAAKVVWKEGNWVDDWDFAQYGKKSDMAKVSRDVQVTFLKKLLEGANKKELEEYVTDVCKKVENGEYNLDYIGIPSKMKKSFEEYKTDRPIIRGSKYANEHLGEQFGKGDKPKYVYVKSTPAGLPDTDVVAFSQVELPDGFKVDRKKMMRKVIQKKLKRILAVLDYSFDEMYRQSSSLLEV